MAKQLFKNFTFSFAANLISVVISMLITLVLPKFLGLTGYSYFQLYLFYVGYIGIFHLGWNDGIYLRYGGKKYEELSREIFFGQFLLQLLMQLFFAGIIAGAGLALAGEEQKTVVILLTAVSMVLTNLRFFFLYILQATSRIKEYAAVTILDRVFFFLAAAGLLALKQEDYARIIWGDLLGRLLSLVLCVYYCRSLFTGKKTGLRNVTGEAAENIRVGSKLLLSNFASALIIGVVRLGIERRWSIETFGQISLMLSISGFAVTFINAVGVVIYPMLRNTEKEAAARGLRHVNVLMTDFLLLVLLLYYPLRYFLVFWLPDYAESIPYIAVLLPICIYEGKLALLYNTFLKSFRKEKELLLINMSMLCMSAALTGIFVFWLGSLYGAVLSILGVILLRSVLCERAALKIFGERSERGIVKEVLLTALFVGLNALLPPLSAALAFALALMGLLILDRKALKDSLGFVRNAARGKER